MAYLYTAKKTGPSKWKLILNTVLYASLEDSSFVVWLEDEEPFKRYVKILQKKMFNGIPGICEALETVVIFSSISP